jgi:hypothetical protein
MGSVIGTMLVLLWLCWTLAECGNLIGYGSLNGLTGRSGVDVGIWVAVEMLSKLPCLVKYQK